MSLYQFLIFDCYLLRYIDLLPFHSLKRNHIDVTSTNIIYILNGTNIVVYKTRL